MSNTLPVCAACGSDLQGNAFCEECGTRARGDWRSGEDSQSTTLAMPASSPAPTPPPGDEPEQGSKASGIWDAVDSGVNKVALGVWGLIYAGGAIVLLTLEVHWSFLLLLAYGIYLLSGTVTGGSRWLIY